MRGQGWYHDPYGVHEERYFSDGQSSKLVSDCGIEAYDPPPPGGPAVPPGEMTPSRVPYSSGNSPAESAPSYDQEAAYSAVQMVLARARIM